MRLFKNYKKLYKSSQNNLKLMQERNADLYKRDLEHQEKAKDEERKLRAIIAKLKLELEDVNGFLQQEKECSEALRKERTKLRKQIKKLGGEWNNENVKRR